MSAHTPFAVFSGTNSRYLAEKICNSLGCSMGQMNIEHFSDGEFSVSYEESIRGKDVFLVQSTFPNADNLMELLLMMDAAKRASAHSVIAVIPYFDPHRQYAFLRKSGREVLLIVANFDRTPRTVRVNIPDEAFRSLPIPDNQAAELTDLFSGTKTVGTLTAACPYEMALPACSGKILKFHYNTQG